MTQFRTLTAIALGCGLIGVAGFATWAKHGESQRFAAIPPALLGESAAQIERGRYVAAMADCAACHTVPGKPEYAGGYSLQTPFGSIQASNITQDPETGIGSWSLEQFDKAVRHGIGRHGYLYPAMPYPAYAKMSDADIADLWSYIKTVEPVHQPVVENQLPFPYNQRFLLAGWNLLFFKDQPFTPLAGVSAQVNRGDYVVNGPGHCAACHTGKNLLGGDLAGTLHGGTLQGWHAPDLTPNPHVGLGKWSSDDLVRYLKTGSNHQAAASGPMLEAVENSTQHLTDADLYAIAAYLQQLQASAEQPGPAIAADDPQMVAGKRVVESQCEACHRRDGHGVRNMIPALRDNAQVNARDAASLINIVLRGAEGPVTAGNPTGAGMPRFDWKMADEDIAAALTYIRNSWGNSAARVSAADVSRARTALGAEAWLMR